MRAGSTLQLQALKMQNFCLLWENADRKSRLFNYFNLENHWHRFSGHWKSVVSALRLLACSRHPLFLVVYRLIAKHRSLKAHDVQKSISDSVVHLNVLIHFRQKFVVSFVPRASLWISPISRQLLCLLQFLSPLLGQVYLLLRKFMLAAITFSYVSSQLLFKF